MNDRPIIGSQVKFMIALHMTGSSLVAGAVSTSGQDAWLCVIFGLLLSIPMVLVYTRILRLYPGQNLYQIVLNIFGSIVGRIICLLYVVYALFLSALVLNIFTEFVCTVNMPETSKFVIGWFFILLLIYAIFCGLSIVIRLSRMLFPIVMGTVLFTIAMAMDDMNLSNLFPLLGSPPDTLINDSLNVFALPFSEIVLFTTFLNLDEKENYNRVFYSGLGLGFFVLLIANLRNILILGPTVLQIFPFPSYQSVSIVSIGEFLTRLEVIVGVNLMMGSGIKACVCIFSSVSGLAAVFNVKENKYFATSSSLLTLMLVGILFENLVEGAAFANLYKYYSIPFQVVLPIIILIAGLIKEKRAKKTPGDSSTNTSNATNPAPIPASAEPAR